MTVCWSLVPLLAGPRAVEPLPSDLTAVSLEELTQIRITSVAKKQQPLTRVAAAAYVITAEDIRRSGAIRIPEALRLAPGLNVAQIDANQWAISARGFNGRFANKLLVMIDGRTIYNAAFSGVYWDLQDVPMEQIERIEVIRGPGATMWGANAVNGVINVITKTAKTTQGGLVSTGFGSQSGPQAMLRHGGAAGGGFYRVYGRYQDRRSSPAAASLPPDSDPLENARGGFRYDFAASNGDQIEVHGDLQRVDGRHPVRVSSPAPPYGSSVSLGVVALAGNVMTRWRRELSDRSDLTFQAYYDVMERDDELTHAYTSNTVDFDLQHRRGHGARGETTWGLGYRALNMRLKQGRAVRSPNTAQTLHYLSGFIQEELEIQPDRLILTVGTKLEQSTLGGFQPQPTARIAWTPTPDTAVWGAVSRALRAPSWGERNASFDGASFPGPFGVGVLAGIEPSPDLSNEKLTAIETGLRLQPAPFLSLDLAAFHNHYDGLRSFQQGALVRRTDPLPHLYLPVTFGNGNQADSYGLELATKWRLRDDWRLTANHGYTKVLFKPGQIGLVEEFDHLQTPTHHSVVMSSWDLPSRVNLDLTAHYVGRALAGGFVRRGEIIPAHFDADVRLEWRANDRTRVTFGGQNLFDPNRVEFEAETFMQGAPVGRNIYGRVEWTF